MELITHVFGEGPEINLLEYSNVEVVGVVERNKIIGAEPWQMTTNSCNGKNAVLRGKDKRRVPSGKTITTIISFSFCVLSETPVLFFLQMRLEKI